MEEKMSIDNQGPSDQETLLWTRRLVSVPDTYLNILTGHTHAEAVEIAIANNRYTNVYKVCVSADFGKTWHLMPDDLTSMGAKTSRPIVLADY
jgi:hypothetical protein